MVALDPRINPFRPEIAASHLRGHVEAKRFVEGSRHQIIEPVTALRRTPSHDARLDTEALLGERVTIYETTDEGWLGVNWKQTAMSAGCRPMRWELSVS